MSESEKKELNEKETSEVAGGVIILKQAETVRPLVSARVRKAEIREKRGALLPMMKAMKAKKEAIY